MAYTHTIKKQIAFSETDMAGIVHFSNFFRFMEMAEHAFLRSMGLSVHYNVEGQSLGIKQRSGFIIDGMGGFSNKGKPTCSRIIIIC